MLNRREYHRPQRQQLIDETACFHAASRDNAGSKRGGRTTILPEPIEAVMELKSRMAPNTVNAPAASHVSNANRTDDWSLAVGELELKKVL